MPFSSSPTNSPSILSHIPPTPPPQQPETAPAPASLTENHTPTPSPTTSISPNPSPEYHSQTFSPLLPRNSPPPKLPTFPPSILPSSHALPYHPPPPTPPSGSKHKSYFPPPIPLQSYPTKHNPPPPLPRKWPGSSFSAAATAGVIAAFITLSTVAILLVRSFRVKRQKYRKKQNPSQSITKPGDGAARGVPVNEQGPGEDWKSWGVGNRYRFGYEELSVATGGFSSENKIGEGGFGFVFKGRLADGQLVAVKRLKGMENRRAARQFQAEIEMVSRVHHRHLVSLLGYCIYAQHRLLVYDYVPNGTLEHHLHGSGGNVIDWANRMKIAIGAARGLAYLHEDCHPQVIHCDIKSSNILLDFDFNARVSDFGLAKLLPDAYEHVTTHVMGTFGYLAPDYTLTGKLTPKSDVYSFGVLMLELVTGRRPIDASQAPGCESLVEWGRGLLEEALTKRDFHVLADPKLRKKFDVDEMLRMMEVIDACLQISPRRRPRMGQIVRMLEKDDVGDPSLSHQGEGDEEDTTQQQIAFARIFNMMVRGDGRHLCTHPSGCNSNFLTSNFSNGDGYNY